MATGLCVRIQRDGRWKSIEIDQLTDEELDELEHVASHTGWVFAKALAKWIRENVSLEIEGEDCTLVVDLMPKEST